jgi:endonuclease III
VSSNTYWSVAIKPLLRKYRGKRHPLDYANVYQLVVMVVLSARDSDNHINQLAPGLFKVFPDMKALAAATPAKLKRAIGKMLNLANKSTWLLAIAQKIKKDSNIPLTLDELTELPGIGRKSANVILREAGKRAEGVMVDLHTLRVATRLGIASGTDPKKIEKQLMETLPQKQWDAGMAMSFLGREICRPKPKCEECLMRAVCDYYKRSI